MTTISDERLADHALNLKMGYLNTEVREMARELQSARVTIREQAERIERLEDALIAAVKP